MYARSTKIFGVRKRTFCRKKRVKTRSRCEKAGATEGSSTAVVILPIAVIEMPELLKVLQWQLSSHKQQQPSRHHHQSEELTKSVSEVSTQSFYRFK
jgi:hypothetical protein